MNNFQIIFDNAGNATLQTDSYVHFYQDMAQLASDLKALIAGEGNTDEWDGNEPENRIDTQSDDFQEKRTNGGYWVVDQDDVALFRKKRASGGDWITDEDDFVICLPNDGWINVSVLAEALNV